MDINYHTGILLSNPISFGMIHWDNSIQESSWAVKRYNDLRWKLQKRKATLKGIVSIAISVIVFGVINWGLYLLFVWLKNPMQLIASAYLDFQLTRLVFLMCEDAFDPNNISVKRRGRYLNYTF